MLHASSGRNSRASPGLSLARAPAAAYDPTNIMVLMRHPRSWPAIALGLAAALWPGCELPPEAPDQEVVTLLFTGSIEGEFCE